MAEKRPPPTESQLAEALKLKDEGNKAYREKQLGTALKHYTSALSLAPSRELFSNRAAVFLALKQPYQALNDINSSLALSPLFYRAIRRKALIFETLERDTEALGVLKEVISVMKQEGDKFELGAKVEAEKKEVEKKIVALQKGLDKPVGMGGIAKVEDMEEMMPGMKIWRAVRRGAKIPSVGTTARRLYDAEVQFAEGLKYLRIFKNMGKDGIRGQLQTLEALTSAMICDIRVARFEHGDIEKLQLCYAFEQAARNAVGHECTPEQTIEIYARRLIKPEPGRSRPEPGKDTPWDFVRPALQVTIRCWLMNGLFRYVTDPETHGANEFKSAIRIIELAREKWADVPPVTRGFTLQETFLRQIYCLYGESLMMKYINKHKNLSHTQKITHLEEIITTAEWIIKSKTTTCKAPPESERVANEPSYWSAFYTHYLPPLARAHSLLGFAHMHLAPLRPIHITPTGPIHHDQAPASELAKYPSIQNTRHITLGAVHYARAASYFPVDEPDRLNTLWYAIAGLIHRGGYLPADLDLLRDMAHRGTTFCEPLFGPAIVPQDNPGKDLSRRHPGPEPEGRFQTLLPFLSWDTVLHKDLDQNEYRRYLWAYNETVVHPELYGGEGEEGSVGKENWRGMLSLVGVMMNVWRERIEGEPGEKVENVGIAEVFGGAEEGVKKVYEEEVGGWICGGEGRREVSC